MRSDTIRLPAHAPGMEGHLHVLRFGEAGARPLVYVQGALHADEIPGMIAAHHLRERLLALEAEGRIRGEIVLVPFANPLGLNQRVLGGMVGRFDLADGANFNRLYPHLTEVVAERVGGLLSDDEAANRDLIRDALAQAADEAEATTPAEHLKRALLRLAITADVVLDLHCDSEAVMHLYTLTPQAEDFAPLAALLGCEAVLVATESGDEPFDEACSRPWFELKERFPAKPIPLACLSTTVELRGQADVSHELAAADAGALVDFLVIRGAIEGPAPQVPPVRCEPTPLAGSEPLVAPVSGMVVFRRAVGERLSAGDVVADIVCPATGETFPVATRSDGVLYARSGTRFASAGKRLGKVAGTNLQRAGKLLSP
ncbi:succinylglutamate desuccinylase/aspartoacylase family protein [Salinarimonas soli]|uniref:Succinylglutamate desuccinylase/aspartoacylase family protein n=1 Tax=Salinarimonas soli TaxID=1638099 RepID=A0A5B2VA11_9HYPH|nr:succinylglutamate desuccinylase/aspartoacylase family protein [Salinarimonas soli]KAA2235851.1 succinylglutamate desuccinylase/aspartoacylase family protein [Salinarimonas soli]